MSLLKAFHTNDWSHLQEAANVALEPLELSRMEQEIVIARMKKLSKDPNFNCANALELVHNAYKEQDWERQNDTIMDLVRPSPSDKKAWKQYEQFIELAVKLLSKHRGIHGDWRTDRYVAVPTNDRSSMGSMTAAAVESVVTWTSNSQLQIIVESVDTISKHSLKSDFKIANTLDAVYMNLVQVAEDNGYVVVEQLYDVAANKIIIELYDKKVKLINVATIVQHPV